MTGPRILVWDLENSPATGQFWGVPYNTNIIRIIEPSHVISFAAKWLGKPGVVFRSDYHLPDGKTFDPDGGGHAGMVEHCRDLLDEADAVVSYNGKRHDTPHILTEMKLAGLTPPSPYHEIDLYRVVRQVFKFQQNKLQFVAEQLGIGSKVAHEGLPLWTACAAGDEKAWGRMRKYNLGDVTLTERAYDELLPWIPPSLHPHVGLGTGVECCDRCGSTDLQRRGFYRTRLSTYQKYQCQGCGGWLRGKTLQETVDVRGVG